MCSRISYQFSKKSKSRFLMSSIARKRRLRRKRRDLRVTVEEMEKQNLNLYLENRCILEQNKKLREKALVLRRENRALLSHLSGFHAANAVVAVPQSQ